MSLLEVIKMEALSRAGFLVYIFLTTVLGLVLFYSIKRLHLIWLIDQLPGPKGLPILGSALEFNLEPIALFKKMMSLCDPNILSPMIKVWFGPRANVLIYKPHSAEVILSSKIHIDKSVDYLFLRPWLGLGLLTSTGKKWHQRRKMLTPSFHFSILEDFMEVFNQQASKFIQILESRTDGKVFDIFHNVTLCTLDIIMETAMGRNINAQGNSESDYVKAVYEISYLVQMRQSRLWLQFDALFKLLGYEKKQQECLKILHGFSYETIGEKRKALLLKKKAQEVNKIEENIPGKRKRFAFLDLLVEYSEKNNALSDEDIREEVDTFMFEGHDTTAASITWCLYVLGEHPEIQEKLIEEVDTIFGDSERDATTADLREMKYLECCIKETLRLFPSVPLIGRELKENVYIDGFTVPSGTTALIIPYCIHRDASQFPEPEVFKPERFLLENAVKLHPYAYIPFSAGPRNCIGQKFALMEEKVILSSFFRKFRIESTVRMKDLQILGQLILRPEGGTQVKISKRK